MITASSGSRLVMKVTTQSPHASVSWRLQLAQSMVTLMSHTVETPYDSALTMDFTAIDDLGACPRPAPTMRRVRPVVRLR